MTGVLEWQQQQIQQANNNNVINQNCNYPEMSKPLSVGNCLLVQGRFTPRPQFKPAGLVMIAPLITKAEREESTENGQQEANTTVNVNY